MCGLSTLFAMHRPGQSEEFMAKLSVEIDSALVDRVHRYSRERGTDVAQTISDLIQRLPESRLPNPPAPGAIDDAGWAQTLPPITRRLLGIASGGVDESEYKDYLWRKYGP
jgi:hypothetical protein